MRVTRSLLIAVMTIALPSLASADIIKGIPNPIPRPTIPPPPRGLRRTVDPRTCTAHIPALFAVFGGAQLCLAALTNNDQVLVWDPPSGTVDGYRVYKITGATATQIGSESESDSTMFDVGAGVVGSCYAVTSVLNGWESTRTNFCVNDVTRAEHTITVYSYQGTSKTFLSYGGDGRAVSSSEVQWVLNQIRTTKFGNGVGGFFGSSYGYKAYGYARMATRWDLSALTGAYVAQADVKIVPSVGLTVDGNGARSAIGLDLGKTRTLFLPNSDWTGWATENGPMVAGDDVDSFQVISPYATPVSIDLTSTVQDWSEGAPNHGLGIRGDFEPSSSTGGDDSGDASFLTLQLDVSYFLADKK